MSLVPNSVPRQASRGIELGAYRLVSELGAGGMGTVWYAEHTTIGRRAAIKVLHPEFARQQEVVARFIDEARAASAIRHPNIVDIHDFGQDAEFNWLVMELLEGETLGARLERQHSLRPEEALPILQEVARALAAAHRSGIVHRDLKPENIFLVSREDCPEQVKLLDFGIAKLTGNPQRGSTNAGVLVGTPTYMSPEQCMGDADLDHRTDIYSLGVVAYEMLSGAPPFVGDTFGRLVLEHMTMLPEPLDQAAPAVGEELAAVVARALEKKPEARFQAIDEFVQACHEAIHPSPKDRLARKARVELEAQQSQDVANELLSIVDRKLKTGRVPLPAMPFAVVEALSVLDQTGCDFDTVAAQLRADPLVTTRVLGLVNSPAFGTREPVKQLNSACRRLGIKPLRSLLVGLAARQVFRSRDPRIRKEFERIWEHCVATALLAKRIAEKTRSLDPAAAYLAGLLHDIGKPVVAAFLLEAERMLLEELGTSWLSSSVWTQTIEAAHQRVGRAVAEHWRLPGEVQEAISYHRSYQPEYPFGNLICYADAIACLEGFPGASEIGDKTDLVVEGRSLLSLDVATESELSEGLAEEVAAMCSLSRRAG